MKTQFALCRWLLVCLCCAISMSGCDGDDEKEKPLKPVKVNFVSASPAPGSTLERDATILLTFDGTPTGVSVNVGDIPVDGTTVSVSGPFSPGTLGLTVNWDDGQQTFTYNVNEPRPPEGMVLIPAGTFQMGSEDAEADKDEQPVHTVHLDAFYMDKYEVTNTQFKAFVDANPPWQKDNNIDTWFLTRSYLKDWTGNDYPVGKANHPVVDVSWYAAMAYAQWAGKRLPTEAEWEYAARGWLAGQKYPWGDTITSADANYNRNVDNTTSVGQYAANGYGLYDMAGNVWEWCLDKYDPTFYTESHNSRNPISGAVTIQELLNNFASVQTQTSSSRGLRVASWRDGVAFRFLSTRVLRGGGWNDAATHLRVAFRYGSTSGLTDGTHGFRCVRAVTP